MNVYFGVIEDRHDPKQMGRVRVRVLGLHSDDRHNEVPINSLPWSTVLQPSSQSTSSSGICQMVEGTWVLVMYMDATLQDPIVLGSLPTSFMGKRPDYEKGFSDPFGVYPKYNDDTGDTTLVGRGERYVEHPTYNNRARGRILNVLTARPPRVDTVMDPEDEARYVREEWSEKDLRDGAKSVYPYNAVREYEGGIIEENDSSPRGIRTSRMHPSGTYEEIIMDGTRTLKIVSDSYEIILGKNNVLIKGDHNITIEGNLKHFVKGDYTLEVGGNYYETVRGNHVGKIYGNRVVEIGQDETSNIVNDHNIKVGRNQMTFIAGAQSFTVGEDRVTQINSNDILTVREDSTSVISGNHNITCIGNRLVVVDGSDRKETTGQIIIDSGTSMNIITETTLTETIGSNRTSNIEGNMTVVTGGIVNLNP